MSSFTLSLQPVFDEIGNAQAIEITMVFNKTGKKKGDILFDHTLMRAVVPTMQYTADSIRLTGSHNSVIGLYTIYTKRNTHRKFRVEQDVPAGERLM